MRTFANDRMALAARDLAAVAGVDVDLLPAAIAGADMQLVVRCDNGAFLSVMRDLDAPALYEIVRLDSGTDELFDKLSLEGTIGAVRRIAAEPPCAVAPT